MKPEKKRANSNPTLILGTFGYTGILLYLTIFWVGIELPEIFFYIFHVISFFILTLLLFECFKKYIVLRIQILVTAAVLTFSLGIIIEVLQVPTARDASFKDLFLDGLGIIIASVSFFKWRVVNAESKSN